MYVRALSFAFFALPVRLKHAASVSVEAVKLCSHFVLTSRHQFTNGFRLVVQSLPTSWGYTAVPSTRNVGKTSKAFISPAVRRIVSRSGMCNSPGDALHVGAIGRTLRLPVPGDLGGNKQTETHSRTGFG